MSCSVNSGPQEKELTQGHWMSMHRVATFPIHSNDNTQSGGNHETNLRHPHRSVSLPPLEHTSHEPYLIPINETSTLSGTPRLDGMTSDIRPVPEVEAAVRQIADDSNTTKAASSVYDRSEEERGESKAFNENAGKVWEFERKSIERRKERIDNLLVFVTRPPWALRANWGEAGGRTPSSE